MNRLDEIVMWLGPEGARAGLEHSDLTIAEIVDLEPALFSGKSQTKIKRAELIKEIVASVRSRLAKSSEELMTMDVDSLKNYFAQIKVSREELLSLLMELDIRPGSAAKKNLTEFAAREIRDIGMYRRIASGTSKEETSE
ncbi:MAG: hypothetical protein JWQ72_354 [Polaromonas sp.]|nr:hypothetical protein [Polaromonas sp.]